MKTLILPIAGKSTRYALTRPKWLLCHPKGKLMLTESIKGLDLTQFDRVVVITLQEYQDIYNFKNYLLSELKELHNNVEILLLDKTTKNQPETVYEGIKQLNITDGIYIKDCDNYFEDNIKLDYNSVSVINLNNEKDITPGNKSYVKLNQNNTISNIVEKQIISNLFCCGGYYFANASDFTHNYEELKSYNNLYISHIIYNMIINKHVFFSRECSNYVDWGTLIDWQKYCKQFKTLFVDIDGTLFKNGSPYHYPKYGESEGLIKNIKLLQTLYIEGKCQVILTTTRSESFREVTEKQLKENDIPYSLLIMNLWHNTRYLINDFATTNTYPSAIAINLERDSDTLQNLLKLDK